MQKSNLKAEDAFPDRPIWFAHTLGLSDPMIDHFPDPLRREPKQSGRGGECRLSGESVRDESHRELSNAYSRLKLSTVLVHHPRFGLIRVTVALAIENPDWERIPYNQEST